MNIIQFKSCLRLLCCILMMSFFVACHKEPIMLNPIAPLDIGLKKSTAEGFLNKSIVKEFNAVVSVAYEDDTIGYNCHFVAVDNIPELYMYDYAHSDVLYVVKGKTFRLLVDAKIGGELCCGESEILVLEGDPLFVSIELSSNLMYIDLGLPSGTLWANCNLGAKSPEDYGRYYAWGEISDKVTYNWETYTFYEDSVLVKYNGTDGLTTLEDSDDVATAMLGNNWRMPTKAEFEELLDNCTTTLTTSNGVNGYMFIGRNGNSIFLPMAGGREGEGLLSMGECGFYWLSSLYIDDADYAWGVIFDANTIYTTSYYRMYGQTIRPVYDGRW